jgi:hypothetical protein
MRKMFTQSFKIRIRILFFLLTLLIFPAFAMNSGTIYANGSFQQEKLKITGTVVDASGTAIPGVSILVKGTFIGAITDLDGKFSLSVDPNDVLIFSFIGYMTQEVSVLFSILH